MKTKLLSIVLVILNLCYLNMGFSQDCNNASSACTNFVKQYPSGNFSSTSPNWSTVSPTINAGNWSLYNVTQGNTYEWTTCNDFGGYQGWNAELSLSNYSNNTKLCYSNNSGRSNCPNAPYIKWTADFTGTVRLLVSVSTTLRCQSNGPSGPYAIVVWRQSAQGQSCSGWQISPTSKPFNSNGGSDYFTVSTTSGCNYTASNESPDVFSSVVSSANGRVDYTVKTNTTISSRSGNISIKDGNGVTQRTFTIYQDGQVTPQYGSVQVTILPQAISNTATWGIEGGSSGYQSGTPQSLPIGNYNIIFSNVNGWTTPNPISITLSANASIQKEGIYTQIATSQYKLTLNPSPTIGGSVSGSGLVNGIGTYSSGQNVQITAIPKTGYKFDNWTESGKSTITANPYDVAMTSDRAIQANFSQVIVTPQYKLTATANSSVGGSVTGTGLINGIGTYNSGQSVSLTATPKTGYKFDNWTESGRSATTLNPYDVVMTSDRTVQANFSPIVVTPQYKITGIISDLGFDLSNGVFSTTSAANSNIKIFRTGETTSFKTITSLSDGSYIFDNLQAGNYDIEAEKGGYSVKIKNISSVSSVNHNIKIPLQLATVVLRRADRISKISLHSNSVSVNAHNTNSLKNLLSDWKTITLDSESDESYYNALARLYIITNALENYNIQQSLMGEALDEQLAETTETLLGLLVSSINIEKILNKCNNFVCKYLISQVSGYRLQATILYGDLLQRIIKDNSKIKSAVPFLEGTFRVVFEKYAGDKIENLTEPYVEKFINKPIRETIGPLYMENMLIAPLEPLIEASVSQQKSRTNQSNLYSVWNNSKNKLSVDYTNNTEAYKKIVALFAFAEYANKKKELFDLSKTFQETSGLEWIVKTIPVFKTIISGVNTGIDIMSSATASASFVLLFKNGNDITTNAKSNLSAVLVPRGNDVKVFNTETASLLGNEVIIAVNDYNTKLNEIKADINSGRFYGASTKLQALYRLDSILTYSVTESLRTIDASYTLSNRNDTLYHQNLYNAVHFSPHHRLAITYQLISTIIDSTNRASINELNELANKTIKSNNEIPNEIQLLNDALSGILSNPYLAVNTIQIKTAYPLSSTNIVKLKYKNYGNTMARNVYAKIGMNDFVTLPKDSFYLGQIAPNTEGSLEFSFKVPSFDTIGSYTIHFWGDNIVSEGKGGAFKIGIKKFSINTQSLPISNGTTNGTDSYEIGAQVIVKATPIKCFKFVNWTEDGIEVSKDSIFSFTSERNRNLVANFKESPKYKIDAAIIPSDGGKVLGTDTYCEDEAITLQAKANPKYKFVNWTDGGTSVGSDSSLQLTIKKARTLTANFELRKITIIATTANGGIVTGGKEYSAGDQITIKASSDKCFKFVSWTENGNIVSIDSIYTFSSLYSRNLIANFEGRQYKLDAKPTTGGRVQGGSGVFCLNELTQLTAIPDSGYKFIGWKNCSATSTFNTATSFILKVTKDSCLIALFTKTSTSLFDIEDLGKIIISPNPNNGIFNISFELNKIVLTDIEIFNATGQMIYSKTLKNQNSVHIETIDVGNVAKGIYLVKIRIGQKEIVEKIFIN